MWRWVPLKAFGFEATVKDCCNKCQRIGSIKKANKEAMSPPIGGLVYENEIMVPSAGLSDTLNIFLDII